MNKTIEWLKSQELPTGGIAAWPGMHAYPEVTGYLIPTFIRYGEDKLAIRCADWLLTVQQPDGSFHGIDGVSRAFDTAAIVEGLKASENFQLWDTAFDSIRVIEGSKSIIGIQMQGDVSYTKAKQNALAWMDTQFVDTAFGPMLRESPQSGNVPAYNIRALAIMGQKLQDYEWLRQRAGAYRSHYYLYALEGLWNMGYKEFVYEELQTLKIDTNEGLLPNLVAGGGSDTCATAQAACLRLRAGMDASEYIDAVQAKVNPDGSLPHDNRDSRKNSWACKYWLDALWYLENGRE